MQEELTAEREEYLIEQAAQYIVGHDLEDFIQLMIEGTLPFGDIVGELGFLMSFPLAVTFFSRSGADFVNMFGFNYKLNANRLLKRVAELKEMRALQQEQQRELKKYNDKKEGWYSRLISGLRRLI